MALPATTPVRFAAQAGTFFIDNLTDPNGDPGNVIDIDLGFTLSGRLELPGFLTGRGLVRLFADEHGGPIDQRIGQDTVAITGATSPTDPPNKTYRWSIAVAGTALPDPSPDSSVYQLDVAFTFQNPVGGHTDIGAVYDLGTFLII